MGLDLDSWHDYLMDAFELETLSAAFAYQLEVEMTERLSQMTMMRGLVGHRILLRLLLLPLRHFEMFPYMKCMSMPKQIQFLMLNHMLLNQLFVVGSAPEKLCESFQNEWL